MKLDICDQGAQAADLYLDLAIRQHASRCTKPTPHPECEWCESEKVEVFANGAKSRFCSDFREEAMQ